MTFLRIFLFLSLIYVSHGIIGGNKFSIKKCPFIVYGEGHSNRHEGRKLSYAGILIANNVVLTVKMAVKE